ncbi:uncharacterized protein B0I36DRAFT_356625 [Microdochium trichocladiopsis]|uniref:Uncharacterized protein n=1 Tax=Microdochium trichocladiopsis TaxID=1682393 RepID=A0A9P9BH83_9PEZI|nr:uncharacterized protein B0I36DRAFT_356625 [Microdochium trichocladiopsis]KAH7009374.1 hypothetical protein B0I36DRAFT_356625 [Microdochium trichocladiopsis]
MEVKDGAVLAHRAETCFLHQTGAQTGNSEIRKYVLRALNLAPPQEKCNWGFTEPSIKLEDLAHAARHLSRKYEVPNSVWGVLLEPWSIPSSTYLTLRMQAELAYHPRYDLCQIRAVGFSIGCTRTDMSPNSQQ